MRQAISTPAQVAELMRGRRKARGIPQQELAEKLGISQARLSVLEKHPESMTLDRLLLLAKLLDFEIVVQPREAKATKSEW